MDSSQALNATSNDDQCPICFIQWNNFIDPSLAVILSCKHACCATCLFGFKRGYEKSEGNESDEFKINFCCVLCRQTIPKNVFEQVAHEVLVKDLVGSFSLLSSKLPFSKEEFDLIIAQILTHKNVEFNINKAENVLFNMIGLVDVRQVDQKLDHEDKQKLYEVARAPVRILQEKYTKQRKALTNINDTESIEWLVAKKELQEIQKKLNAARKNAAADIFERMNSLGTMGAIIEDSESFSHLRIDLHGLHVNEAKEKINEFVMPILPALKKVIVITGYGAHTQSGDSILKEAIKQYFVSLNVNCIESTRNKGILCVSVLN